jgi:hypothetical protein
MKCQDVLKNLSEKPYLKKYLCLRFDKYSYDDEYSFIKIRDKIIDLIIKTFSSREPRIKLDDPQKRLEDNLTELARITNSDLKTIREVLTNQINDVAAKLNNAQQRLEDSLLESSRKNVNNLESTKEDSSSKLFIVEANLKKSQDQILLSVENLYRMSYDRFYALKQSFIAKFKKMEENITPTQTNIQRSVMELLIKTNEITNTQKREFFNLDESNNNCIGHMKEFLLQNARHMNQTTSLLSITSDIATQMNNLNNEVSKMNSEIMELSKNFTNNSEKQKYLIDQVETLCTGNSNLIDQVINIKNLVEKIDENVKNLANKESAKQDVAGSTSTNQKPPPTPPPSQPPASFTPLSKRPSQATIRGIWRN